MPRYVQRITLSTTPSHFSSGRSSSRTHRHHQSNRSVESKSKMVKSCGMHCFICSTAPFHARHICLAFVCEPYAVLFAVDTTLAAVDKSHSIARYTHTHRGHRFKGKEENVNTGENRRTAPATMMMLLIHYTRRVK